MTGTNGRGEKKFYQKKHNVGEAIRSPKKQHFYQSGDPKGKRATRSAEGGRRARWTAQVERPAMWGKRVEKNETPALGQRKESHLHRRVAPGKESLCCSARHDTRARQKSPDVAQRKKRCYRQKGRFLPGDIVAGLPPKYCISCRPLHKICTLARSAMYCTLSSYPPGFSIRGWHTRFAQSCACATRDLRDDDDDNVRTGSFRVPHDHPLARSCLDLLRSCHLTSGNTTLCIHQRDVCEMLVALV